MMNKWFVWVLLLVLLVPTVLGIGSCQLDKYDYHVGESALFSCSCTRPNEEGQAGFFVWQNDTDVLQSVAVNSGLCRTNFFTNTYVFLDGQNFTGNVTFSLNADGTGIPTNWDDVTDVNWDVFNVSGSHLLDCIIYGITANRPDVGENAVIKFHVKDSVTNNDLSNVRCGLSMYDTSDFPLYVHTNGNTYERSLTDGEVYFQHRLSEIDWIPNQALIAELHCACYGNSNDTSNLCYDEFTGAVAGFKFCTVKTPIILGSGDFRNGGNILSVVLVFLGLIVLFGVVSYFSFKFSGVNEDKKSFWLGLFSLGIMIIETLFLVGVLYMNERGLNLVGLLHVHFIVMVIAGSLIGFSSLILLVLFIFRWKTDGDDSKKW